MLKIFFHNIISCHHSQLTVPVLYLQKAFTRQSVLSPLILISQSDRKKRICSFFSYYKLNFFSFFQDIPLHASTLTFLLLAWDRFRFIRNPHKPRLPAFVCIVGIWLTALCLVLPYPIYIIYIDLSVSNWFSMIY